MWAPWKREKLDASWSAFSGNLLLNLQVCSSLATDYKLWYVTYVHRCDCFFTDFANLKRWAANKLLQNSKQASMHCLVKHKTVKSCSCTKRYCVSKMKLLMSGDIELNPGPEQNVCDQTALSVGSTLLLNYRLRQLGLRPLDNFLYFSFTTSCLEIKLCSIHFIVTNVMLKITNS